MEGHVFENVNTYQGNNHHGSFDPWSMFACQVNQLVIGTVGVHNAK